MTFKLGDRVKETTLTTGTGPLALGGAVTKFQAFSDVLSSGDTTWYAISHRNASEWETGLGTYTAGVLTRTSVYSSSNSGAAVNFSSGTKDVWINTHAAALEDLATANLKLTGGTLTGALDMGGQALTGLVDATDPTDAMSLQATLDTLPAVDLVKSYGVVLGVDSIAVAAANSAAIQQAFDDYPNGADFYLRGDGDCFIYKPLVRAGGNFRIRGDSKGSTTIKPSQATPYVFGGGYLLNLRPNTDAHPTTTTSLLSGYAFALKFYDSGGGAEGSPDAGDHWLNCQTSSEPNENFDGATSAHFQLHFRLRAAPVASEFAIWNKSGQRGPDTDPLDQTPYDLLNGTATGTSAGHYTFELYYSSGKIRGGMWINGTFYILEAPTAISVGTWYLIDLALDGGLGSNQLKIAVTSAGSPTVTAGVTMAQKTVTVGTGIKDRPHATELIGMHQQRSYVGGGYIRRSGPWDGCGFRRRKGSVGTLGWQATALAFGGGFTWCLPCSSSVYQYLCFIAADAQGGVYWCEHQADVNTSSVAQSNFVVRDITLQGGNMVGALTMTACTECAITNCNLEGFNPLRMWNNNFSLEIEKCTISSSAGGACCTATNVSGGIVLFRTIVFRGGSYGLVTNGAPVLMNCYFDSGLSIVPLIYGAPGGVQGRAAIYACNISAESAPRTYYEYGVLLDGMKSGLIDIAADFLFVDKPFWGIEPSSQIGLSDFFTPQIKLSGYGLQPDSGTEPHIQFFSVPFSPYFDANCYDYRTNSPGTEPPAIANYEGFVLQRDGDVARPKKTAIATTSQTTVATLTVPVDSIVHYSIWVQVKKSTAAGGQRHIEKIEVTYERDGSGATAIIGSADVTTVENADTTAVALVTTATGVAVKVTAPDTDARSVLVRASAKYEPRLSVA